MRLAKLLLVACIASVAAGCGNDDDSGAGGSSAGCTPEACDAIVGTCRMAPIGIAPACAGLPDRPADASTAECLASCRAFGSGPAFQCILDNVSRCEQAYECTDSDCRWDALSGLLDLCTPGPLEEHGEDCVRACNVAASACEAACPTDTYAACADCALDCGRAQGACVDGCPAAP